MQSDPIPGTSSDISRVYDPQVSSIIILDKTAGPSVRKLISIERTALNERVISFKNTTTTHEAKFHEPISASKCNSEFRKKYSKKNQAIKNNLEEKLIKHYGKLSLLEFHDILNCEKCTEIFLQLFIISVYSIQNYFGKAGPKGVEQNELYLYIHQLIPISKIQQNECYEFAKHIPAPEFCINFIILEGIGLKYISNSSYLYCKVWMSNKKKSVEMTKYVDGSAHPIWNVRFIFLIENLMSDAITIEMYCIEKDLHSSYLINSVSRIKNILYKTVFKKSDCNCGNQGKSRLIGKAEIRIHDIYSEGIDEWIPLICTKAEFENIFLHIEAKFRVSNIENRLEGLKKHLLLLKICTEDGFKNRNVEKITKWEQFLNNSALTLIFLHSVITSLTGSEDILTKFSVITHLGMKEDILAFEFFYYLLNEVAEHLKRYSCDFIEPYLQNAFEKEVKSLHDCCFNFIRSLHAYNLVQNENFLVEFEFTLKIIYLCKNLIDIASAPLLTLKSEAHDWLGIKAKKMMNTVPEHRVLFIIDVLDYLMQYQKAVDNIFKKIFREETYTHLIYKYLDDELLEPLRFHISEFCREFLEIRGGKDTQNTDSMREKGVELFSKMKQFVLYISVVSKVSVLDLKLGKFREWFRNVITIDWFQWGQMQAEKEIYYTAISDNFVNESTGFSYDLLKESISARKTCEILEKSLKELWHLISVPRALKYDQLFINGLHRCCMKYGCTLLELILSRNLPEEFHHQGKKCLCVIANNIWYVALFAERTIQDTVEKVPPNYSDTKLSLEHLCQKAFSYIIVVYMAVVTSLLKTALEKYLKENNDTLVEYKKYLEKVIWYEIFPDLSFDIFVKFLRCMNNEIIKLLQQFLQQQETLFKCAENKIIYYKLVLQILNVTKEIFNIPNKPPENEIIWNKSCERLISDIRDIVE